MKRRGDPEVAVSVPAAKKPNEFGVGMGAAAAAQAHAAAAAAAQQAATAATLAAAQHKERLQEEQPWRW